MDDCQNFNEYPVKQIKSLWFLYFEHMSKETVGVGFNQAEYWYIEF